MRKEELEITRNNCTPSQFVAYVRSRIKAKKIKCICAADINLEYWARGNDLNFNIDNSGNPDAGCKREKSISKPYEMQTYVLNWDGTVYNMIMEFNFWDEKTGNGYFYFINTEN